jgi:hypothetical protein
MRQTNGLMLFLLLAIGPAFSLAGPQNRSCPLSRLETLLNINPRHNANFSALEKEAGDLIEIAKAQQKEIKAGRKQIRQTTGLDNPPVAELQHYFHEPPGVLTKRDARGLAELFRLARAVSEAQSLESREAHLADLQEVMVAMRNNRRSPVPEELTLSSPLRFLFRDVRRSVGKGHSLAINLAPAQSTQNDLSLCDPAPSSFWTRPPDVPNQDLYAGFGRDRRVSLTDPICRYEGPKTSRGTRAGFDVECAGTRYQVKFGEVNSEPFTARIFHALGYHVDPTDYTPQIKVRYDRRLLREFNMRQPLTMRIKPLGIPLGAIRLQPRHDPFKFIVSAVFKDGRRVSGIELKKLLFIQSDLDEPENEPGNFREDAEAALDYLIMGEANIQPKDTPAENLGSWEFGGLGHERRRELRGAALLAAWLGWCDTRWDNTRLRTLHADGQAQLQFFFTDLGAGMGGATGWFRRRGEDPNQFTWTFTRPAIVRGPGRMTSPFKVTDYRTLVPTAAFREMTLDDARWMARLVGQLTESQLRAALIASGYNAAEVKLYQEKLVSRRDRMIRDLNLTGEIPLLRPAEVDRQFSFNPSTDGTITVTLQSGEAVAAKVTAQIIRNGRLIPPGS